MSWRVARSLLVLRDEVDALAPGRSRASDGTIGDAAHASRSSDHNPYIIDAQGIGVVRALDVTHDPDGGLDAYDLAERLRQLGAAGDPRIRYVISNGRIASPRDGWRWRRYTGVNAHTSHTHLSVVEDAAGYDSTAPWGLTGEPDVIAYNTRNSFQVRQLQTMLNRAAEDQGGFLASAGSRALKVDGHAGALTFAAVAEMLDRGAQDAFAGEAAADLLTLLGQDPTATLQREGISSGLEAFLYDLAAAR